jgi:hypothetical protein
LNTILIVWRRVDGASEHERRTYESLEISWARRDLPWDRVDPSRMLEPSVLHAVEEAGDGERDGNEEPESDKGEDGPCYVSRGRREHGQDDGKKGTRRMGGVSRGGGLTERDSSRSSVDDEHQVEEEDNDEDYPVMQ